MINRKKLFTLVVGLVLVTLSLTACNSGAAKFPTGRFVNAKDDSREVEYTKDNTWFYYMGGLMSAKGTYRVDGNLWVEEGTPECPFPASYQWSYDGKDLSFKLNGEDKCDPRREATDGQTFTLEK